MKLTSTIFKVVDRPFTDSVDIYIAKKDRYDGKLFLVSEIVLKEDDQHELPENAPLSMNQQDARQLMQQLWNIGIRPIDFTDQTDHVQTLKDEVKSLRQILAKLMDNKL